MPWAAGWQAHIDRFRANALSVATGLYIYTYVHARIWHAMNIVKMTLLPPVCMTILLCVRSLTGKLRDTMVCSLHGGTPCCSLKQGTQCTAPCVCLCGVCLCVVHLLWSPSCVEQFLQGISTAHLCTPCLAKAWSSTKEAGLVVSLLFLYSAIVSCCCPSLSAKTRDGVKEGFEELVHKVDVAAKCHSTLVLLLPGMQRLSYVCGCVCACHPLQILQTPGLYTAERPQVLNVTAAEGDGESQGCFC